jgi:carboxylesterase
MDNFQNRHLDGSPFTLTGGPTGVLLIHGFTATTSEVRTLANLLHARGYTISAPLLPGHNTQWQDLNRVRWQDWAAEVERAYLALRGACERVFVGGESTGGLLALFLACEHPEAQGILAYAPALRLAAPRFDQFRLRLAAPFVPNVPKGSIDVETSWSGYTVNPLKGAVQLLNLQRVVRQRLHEIHQPLLVVQGRLDTTVHPGVPAELEHGVSSAIKEVYWMEKSSHVVIIDQEIDQVAEITERFMLRAMAAA